MHLHCKSVKIGNCDIRIVTVQWWVRGSVISIEAQCNYASLKFCIYSNNRGLDDSSTANASVIIVVSKITCPHVYIFCGLSLIIAVQQNWRPSYAIVFTRTFLYNFIYNHINSMSYLSKLLTNRNVVCSWNL